MKEMQRIEMNTGGNGEINLPNTKKKDLNIGLMLGRNRMNRLMKGNGEKSLERMKYSQVIT